MMPAMTRVQKLSSDCIEPMNVIEYLEHIMISNTLFINGIRAISK
jgi:hypothetical protein